MAREHGAELLFAHPIVGNRLPALDASALAFISAEPVTEALHQRSKRGWRHAGSCSTAGPPAARSRP